MADMTTQVFFVADQAQNVLTAPIAGQLSDRFDPRLVLISGFIFFALLAPNVFATIGIFAAYTYAYLTHTDFKTGTYVLFAVLCGSASYIAVPAVQRLAIPEASPTLPLAASLGLTFSYNVTIGIPLYIEIVRLVGHWFPGT